jgi:hypothetical protein
MLAQTFGTVLLAMLTTASALPSASSPQSASPVLRALRFFENLPAGEASTVLRNLRPAPTSSAVRRQVLATLPSEGELTPKAMEMQKLANLKPVFVYHERDAVFDIKLIDVPQAAIGLHARSVLLISRPALRLLSGTELQAVAAHEIGHEYFWDEYEHARTRDDFRARQELELKCDGIAVLTLLGLGLDPTAIGKAMRKLTEFNASIGAVDDRGQYPSIDDRLRFARALTSMPRWTWRLHIQNPSLRESARRMLEEAALWLSFSQCQQVLSDFADRRGRQLTAKLTDLGVTAGEYLRLIIFEDGAKRGDCRRDGILAFTSPGSRVIYLCGQEFVRAAHRAPEEIGAVIIHEMLHSLGLGENPPSSKEITYRVKQRCWN